MWRFFDVDQGVSSCKLSREYFLLWVITTSLYGNTNTSTLPVCTNKTVRDKSYILTKKNMTIRKGTKYQLTHDDCHSMEKTNTTTLPVCTNKTKHDKSLHDK